MFVLFFSATSAPLREYSYFQLGLKRSSIAPGGEDGQPAMRFTLLLLLVFASLTRAASGETMLLQRRGAGNFLSRQVCRADEGF